MAFGRQGCKSSDGNKYGDTTTGTWVGGHVTFASRHGKPETGFGELGLLLKCHNKPSVGQRRPAQRPYLRSLSPLVKSGQVVIKAKDTAVVGPHCLEKTVAVKETVVEGRQLSLGAGEQLTVKVNGLFQLSPFP